MLQPIQPRAETVVLPAEPDRHRLDASTAVYDLFVQEERAESLGYFVSH